jgi:hypothetical protein
MLWGIQAHPPAAIAAFPFKGNAIKLRNQENFVGADLFAFLAQIVRINLHLQITNIKVKPALVAYSMQR